MLVVFRVVTAVESPGSLAIFSVDISGFSQRFVFAHDDDGWLNVLAQEGSSLAHKALDYLSMVLA